MITRDRPTRSTLRRRPQPKPRRRPTPGLSLTGIRQLLAWIAGTRLPSSGQLALRTWGVIGVLLLGLGGLGARLVDLQVHQAPELHQRAQAQHHAQVKPFIPRRSIIDRHSVVDQQAELLAVDRPVYTLWAHPRLFNNYDAAQISTQLAPLLKRSEQSLRERLSGDQTTAIRLERWVPVEVADQIQNLFIDGLELVSERQRIYPQKQMAAEVVGYVDLDHRGQAGVEYSRHELLERNSRSVTVPRDGRGQLAAAEVPDGLLQSSETVLQLTLDMRLQRAARAALQQQITRFNALRGAVIVMQPQSGEILAMASEPTYDPNRYYDGYDPGLFRNWAVTDLYEPGSTFKPINIAIGLELGGFKRDATIYDEGRITIGQWPIQNYDYQQRGKHGWMTVTDILKRSSNVGMVHLMEQLQPQQYYDALIRAGLNQPNGVDLPFAPDSQLKDRQQFTRVPIERATTSFGQGFSLTPLDLTTIHAALANGGQRVIPHVVKGLVERDTGEVVWQPSRSTSQRIWSEQTTQIVRAQMRDVVDYGTGRSAHIEGYEIGGKTGTAQKARPNGGGYFKEKRITSFIGYFPAMEPNYVILAVVDEPQGDDAYGSSVAAPIVRSVIQEIIAINGIMPEG